MGNAVSGRAHAGTNAPINHLACCGVVVDEDFVEHSGFVQSDWPIWTDFVGGNSDDVHFFLVRATEKIKTVLDQKIPQKIIGGVQVVLVYLNISKNRCFQK